MDFQNFSTVAICRLYVSCVFLLAHCQRISSGRGDHFLQVSAFFLTMLARAGLVVVSKLLTTRESQPALAGNCPRECPYPSLINGNQGLGAGVGRGLGEGAILGLVNSIVRIGGLALSRVSNRFAVAAAVSSPNTSQPKLLAGLSSHDCTSATICAELHVYCPVPPTDWLALTVAEKSPPCVVQKMVSKKRCRHVASFVVAGAPSPSSHGAMEVPSPQSASSLCSSTSYAVSVGVMDIFMLRLTAVIVEPGGIASSNVEREHAPA